MLIGAVVLSYINYKLIPDVVNAKPREQFGLDFDLSELSFGDLSASCS